MIGHHASHSGTTPAADDAVFYDVTIASATGCSCATGRPVTKRDAAANTRRASCNYSQNHFYCHVHMQDFFFYDREEILNTDILLNGCGR